MKNIKHNHLKYNMGEEVYFIIDNYILIGTIIHILIKIEQEENTDIYFYAEYTIRSKRDKKQIRYFEDNLYSTLKEAEEMILKESKKYLNSCNYK